MSEIKTPSNGNTHSVMLRTKDSEKRRENMREKRKERHKAKDESKELKSHILLIEQLNCERNLYVCAIKKKKLKPKVFVFFL